MNRAKPLRSKRPTPRRKAPERVYSVRQKPKAGARPSATETRHMRRVAGLPCLVCGLSPVTLHHPTASIYGGRCGRSHHLVTPLCPAHHLIQHGPKGSVEALGHRGFYIRYGIDLLDVAERLWRETKEGALI